MRLAIITKSQFIFLKLSLLTVLICSNALAQNTQWEIGAGISAIDFRLYPGSRQSKTYVLPLPYFTYRSKYLEIDRGIRGILPSGSNWYLDISADFGIPVNSKKSIVRTGMPNLDSIIQFGPSLQYSIIGSRKQAEEFRLELPIRTAISIDTDHIANQGVLFEPRLVYEKRRSGQSGFSSIIRAGLRYATKDYHAYYYDVSPADVTPQRSFFESGKGFSGFLLDLRASWRDGDVLFWSLFRYHSLNDAVFVNSPLIEDENYFLAAIGISWIFAANI